MGGVAVVIGKGGNCLCVSPGVKVSYFNNS